MTDRRRALRRILTGSAALGLPLSSARAGTADDPAWLAALATRRTAAFLDVRSFTPDGSAFRKAANLIAALTGDHGLPAADVGVAFGASATAVAHLLGPAAWAAFPLGHKLAALASPEEAVSLRRDPQRWGSAGAEGIQRLRQQGVRVLACRNTLERWAKDFTIAGGPSVDVVRGQLLAALHDGVEVVPAMIAAAVLAQGRGLAYVAIA